MAARGSAENAEFMLQANQIHVRNVEEIGRAQIGGQVLLRNLKAYLRGIIVTAREIVDRHDEALHRRKLCCYGTTQVSRERGDAAFPRQVIAEKCNFADFRWLLHNHSAAENLPLRLF